MSVFYQDNIKQSGSSWTKITDEGEYMKEAGGIGRVASVVPVLGRAASFVPSFGGRIGFGIEGGFKMGRISNPFISTPEAASYLENRGFSLHNPLGIETIRNPFIGRVNRIVQSFIPISEIRPLPGVLERQKGLLDRFSVADVVVEAEAIVRKNSSMLPRHSREGGNPIKHNIYGSRIEYGMTKGRFLERKVSGWVGSIVKTPEPEVVKLPNPSRGVDIRVISNPFPAPKVETRPQSRLQAGWESGLTSRVTRITPTPTLNQTYPEQEVEEKKVMTEDKKKEETKAKKNEKTATLKVKLVEAVQVSERRRLEIKTAVKKAKAEVDKLGLRGITGRLVRKLLANTFWEHKSPVVGEGKDGTINPTVEELEKNTTEYKDAKEAENALVQVVAKHIPVQQGEGGRTATFEEAREVLEGKEKEAIKAQTPAEIVIKRVMIQKGETFASTGQAVNTLVEEKEESSETSLKDFPVLAEVFQKAA